MRIKSKADYQCLGKLARAQIEAHWSVGQSSNNRRNANSRIQTDAKTGLRFCPYPSSDPVSILHGELIRRYGSYFDGGDIVSEMILPGHQVAFRFDFAFVSRRLLLEFDGFAFHRQLHSFQNDREKERHAQINGWQVLAITNHAVRYQRSKLMDDIEKICSLRPIQSSSNVIQTKGFTQCVFIGN